VQGCVRSGQRGQRHPKVIICNKIKIQLKERRFENFVDIQAELQEMTNQYHERGVLGTISEAGEAPGRVCKF
jgi:hypothetical protein